jgi:hypothetical protein
MSKQVPDLAWDISEWDKDADLSLSNIRYNIEHTFLSNGLALPSAIACRHDQARDLFVAFDPPYVKRENGICSIGTPYGDLAIKEISKLSLQ